MRQDVLGCWTLPFVNLVPSIEVAVGVWDMLAAGLIAEETVSDGNPMT